MEQERENSVILNEVMVHEALERELFVPFFQPIVDSVSGLCVGAEVLARLIMPDGTVFSPADFLPVLSTEKAHYLLTHIILKKVAALLPAWSLPERFMLTLNIPANLLGQAWLVQECGWLLSRSAHPVDLVLEITEHTPLTLADSQVKSRVESLRQAGIRLALDDFGTGYSGLNILQQLPFDILKIPGKFTCSGDNDSLSSRLLENILHLASVCNLTIIAEGVENARQSYQLRGKGLHLQQGYYFSRPLSGEYFSRYADSRLCLSRQQGLFTASDAVGAEETGLSGALLRCCARRHQLSRREEEVMAFTVRGYSVSEIAKYFRRSIKTLSAQKRSVYRKLGVRNDATFIHYLYRMRDE
ncbi:TPA: EAL domain-containing protein [Citrobacter werkmanii]|nr:EAL domain-containing protein [Citrobacter werkmanii]